MQQPHTEQDLDHKDGQQDTGNHRAPGAGRGADEVGATRAGAENLEEKKTNIESGPDVSKVADLEENLDESVSVNGPTERAPERDERGRM